MDKLTEIQFDSPSCGHHGPYTFFRSFSYRRVDQEKRSIAIGEFFFVRILAELPVCIAELQLLWESQRSVGTKLASVKLYFTPDDTPSGRKPHHGLDELLVADEKVVLEIEDLVKWILESPVGWNYGFEISSKLPESAERKPATGSSLAKNGCQWHDGAKNQTCVDPTVIIVNFPQYCRYRAMARRLEKMNGSWLQNVLVQAISGITVTAGRLRLMFCRETFEHPVLTFHDFRKDRLAPKLKGRKRRKKFSRQESVESIDSDAGAEKMVAMAIDDGQFKPTVKRATKFGLTLPQYGLDLINSGKDVFEQRLYKFMRERKTPIKRIPSLGFKEVDLFQFFMYAQKYGGYDKVTEGRHWKHIYDQMGGHPGNTSAATCTRRIYEKLLLCFERHVRGEEDKPMPVSYMRPARKKLQELPGVHSALVKPVQPHVVDMPISSDFLPVDQDSSLPNKISEASSEIIMESKTYLEALTDLKDEDSDHSQSSRVHHGFESRQEKSLHQICSTRPNSSAKEESNSSKDNSSLEDALPVSSTELPSSVLDVGSSCPPTGAAADPLCGPSSAASLFCTESMPWFKGDDTVAVSSQASAQFITTASLSSRFPLVKVANKESLESSKVYSTGVATATSSSAGSSMELVATKPYAEQKPVPKECAVLSPDCIPSYMGLTYPLSRTGLTYVRPTYGPPNLINSLPVLPNGQNEIVLSKSLNFEKSFLAGHHISSVSTSCAPPDVEGSSVCKESREKTPPRKCNVVGASGSWFDSPIKQFLDRTRALSSGSRLNEADDQPVDLSMKSMNAESHLSFMNSLHKEQDEPLNLSKKSKHCDSRRGAKAKTAAAEAGVDAKKPAMCSSVDAGKVILPKSDQYVPLILSVPSLSVATPHPLIMSNVPSLSMASVPNKPPLMKSGFATVPAVLPASPFPTSLIGAAIRPVLQFFPSPGIALSSEPGRPFLLRFPLPVPVSAPVPTTQASILVPKTNRS